MSEEQAVYRAGGAANDPGAKDGYKRPGPARPLRINISPTFTFDAVRRAASFVRSVSGYPGDGGRAAAADAIELMTAIETAMGMQPMATGAVELDPVCGQALVTECLCCGNSYDRAAPVDRVAQVCAECRERGWVFITTPKQVFNGLWIASACVGNDEKRLCCVARGGTRALALLSLTQEVAAKVGADAVRYDDGNGNPRSALVSVVFKKEGERR